MPEFIPVHFIHARTGCSCCSDENFMQGPYLNLEEAEALMAKWASGDGNPLASQYARNGSYSIHTSNGEMIPHNRVIVADEVWYLDRIEQRPSY